MKLVSTESKGHYKVHRLSLESIEEQESDAVLLFHFSDWPCHSVPNSGVDGLSEMLQQIIRSKSTQQAQVDTVRLLKNRCWQF